MLSTILIIVIVGCFVGIVYVLAKHLTQARAVDQATSPVVKQMLVKNKIIEERLKRKFFNQGSKLWLIVKPAGRWLILLTRNIFTRAISLEEKYRTRILKETFKKNVNQQQFINSLIQGAKNLEENHNFPQAEKKYIEALNLDESNIEAYQGLVQLYYDSKEYDQAQETLQFLTQLQPDKPEYHEMLGEVASERGDLILAEQSYLKALALAEEDADLYIKLAEVYLNSDDKVKAHQMATKAFQVAAASPKVLDFLIETSIIVQDRDAALQAYQNLKASNPENKKLEEFWQRIKEL